MNILKHPLSKKTKNKLKSYDELAPSVQTMLHIDLNMIQKTFLGGFLSYFAYVLVFLIAMEQAKNMVQRHQPYIQSIETPVDSAKDGLNKYGFKDINSITFSVVDNRFRKFSLKDIKPYIEIRIRFRKAYFKGEKRIYLPEKLYQMR